jgi:uncharacterized protein HemX
MGAAGRGRALAPATVFLLAAAAGAGMLAGGCSDESEQVKSLKLTVEECRQQVTRYHVEALEQREIVENLKKNLESSDKKIQILNRELLRTQERVKQLEQALKVQPSVPPPGSQEKKEDAGKGAADAPKAEGAGKAMEKERKAGE